MRVSESEGTARLEQLFAWHYPAVLAYALRRAPRAVAEDVASETFVVVSRRIQDVPADALPWLYGVARRVLANEQRGAARRDRLFQELVLNVDRSGRDVACSDTGQVMAALAQLPQDDREALMLVAWEGLSGAEAAAAAGCSPVAMRARLSRARRRLARVLAGETGMQFKAATGSPDRVGGASCSVIERSS